MAPSQKPPTPNWSTHPLAQKVLKSFKKLESMAPTALTTPGFSAPLNAVYYPNWKVYDTPPSSMELDKITHVYYAFAFDTQVAVDGTNGGLNAVRNLKLQNPSLKTLLSIGGGGKGSDPFAGVAASPAAREQFGISAKQMLDTYGLDGLDVDWEHPDDKKKGADYTTLMATLREHLPAPKYLLTSALPAGAWSLQYIDLGKAVGHMDYVNLMAYDFAGPWGKMSGYQAQLHVPPNSPEDMRNSGQTAVDYMRSKGVPADKITLGIPAYGHSFIGASNINQPFKPSGGDEGTFEYTKLPRPGAVEKVNRDAVAAYCVGGDGGLVTYDNPETVRMKAQFAKEQKLAGLFYWTGPGDMKGPRSLVSAGYEAMRSS
ncbi:MAG: hypothetical protein LQ349_006504 [Xanthoria aureola]|nr:MAG: hypothetical protein LQ349_006504 [Xanthoria aureola]